MGIVIWNCLWFLLPVLAWNIIFTSRLTQKGFQEDAPVPKWLAVTENIFRFAVFLFPILLPINLISPANLAGLFLLIGGMTVYFISWVPLMNAPKSRWSRSVPGILAPHVLPLLFFFGIALIGESWIYAVLGVCLTAFHVWRGPYSFELIEKKNKGTKKK